MALLQEFLDEAQKHVNEIEAELAAVTPEELAKVYEDGQTVVGDLHDLNENIVRALAVKVKMQSAILALVEANKDIPKRIDGASSPEEFKAIRDELMAIKKQVVGMEIKIEAFGILFWESLRSELGKEKGASLAICKGGKIVECPPEEEEETARRDGIVIIGGGSIPPEILNRILHV